MQYFGRQEYCGSSTSSFNNSEDDIVNEDHDNINQEVIKQIRNNNSLKNAALDEMCSADGGDPDDDLEDDFEGDQ